MENHTEIDRKIGALIQWQEDHAEEDRKLFEERPTKDEMKEIVHAALVSFFTSKGALTKNFLVTTAVIIGALAVIVGGFKAVLGWFGFSIMK